MSPNTLKTVLGFLATMLEKYTPIKLSKHTLEGIYNYHPINDQIATSGQPSEAQFSLIKQAGYHTVINLAPHDHENSLPDEAALLSELALRYEHIPVDFKAPAEEDYQAFVAALQRYEDQNIWIHCAANMRVSAFLYRYRCEVLHEDPVAAKVDLEKIWQPFGIWAEFIAKAS